MQESNLNNNSDPKSSDLDKENGQSSFVLQPCSNDYPQQTERFRYRLGVPLCVAQTYEEDFFNHFHFNYCGEFDQEGLFLASIRTLSTKTSELDGHLCVPILKINDEENKQLICALIRTECNNYHISQWIDVKDEEKILEILCEKAQLPSIHHYQWIRDILANEKILEFDRYNDEQQANKIAIVLQRAEQLDESAIFSNDEMSREMEDFLNFIGERVKLEGFKKYRGDLDVKTNQHGEYSYFSNYKNHQIMFNVAPIIPSDQQSIQRKSLISNALLCIVFQEKDASFHPDLILSRMTQVYITIQPKKIDDELYYKLEIWRRSDIDPIDEPASGIFKKDNLFRDFFLTLMLNTIDSILKKDVFNRRIVQQRQRLKRDYLEKLSQTFSHSTEDRPGVKSASKTHHLSLIPKIVGSFSKHRLRSASSVLPSSVSDEERTKFMNSSSTIETDSFLSRVDRVIRSHDHSKEEDSRATISSLIPTVNHSLGSTNPS